MRASPRAVARTRKRSERALYRAIADATRRAILDDLQAGPRTAGQIAERFPVSRPAISRHLRLLRGADLVREERRGRERIYVLAPSPLREIHDWLDRYRLHWAAQLIALKEFVESQPTSLGDEPSVDDPEGGSK